MLRVASQERCGIVPTAGSYDVNRDAGVQEQGLVGAAEIVQAQLWKTEHLGPTKKFLGGIVRLPQVGE